MASFADIFRELGTDLDSEGKDLERSLANVSPRDDLHPWTTQERTTLSPWPCVFLLDKIPDCLLASNVSFRLAFFHLLNDLRRPVDPFPLQQLAILTYKMNIVLLHQQLWQSYSQWGTGPPEGFTFAPCSPPLPEGSPRLANGDVHAKNMPPIDGQIQTDFVQQRQAFLNEQHRRYRAQFETLKSQLTYFTEALGYHLERYVSKTALVPVRPYLQARMALIKHAYNDRVLQLEFFAQKPTDDQVGSLVARSVLSLHC